MKLSIGGTHFHDVKVDAGPRLRLLLCLSQRPPPPTLDDVGATFVDPRRAQHFPKILAFLRDGAIPQWSDEGERDALEREADFYQIEALMRVVGAAANMVFAPVPRTSACATRRTAPGALRERARRPSDLAPAHAPHRRLFVATTFVGGGVELDELRDVPTLARFHTHRPPATGASSVVPSVDVFRRQFCSFAGGCSRGLTGRKWSPPDPLR